MSQGDSSSEEQGIDQVLRSNPPTEGATLQGWTTLAEWKKPAGEMALVLMGRPEANLVQLKGYMHSALLKMVWKEYGQP